VRNKWDPLPMHTHAAVCGRGGLRGGGSRRGSGRRAAPCIGQVLPTPRPWLQGLAQCIEPRGLAATAEGAAWLWCLGLATFNPTHPSRCLGSAAPASSGCHAIHGHQQSGHSTMAHSGSLAIQPSVVTTFNPTHRSRSLGAAAPGCRA